MTKKNKAEVNRLIDKARREYITNPTEYLRGVYLGILSLAFALNNRSWDGLNRAGGRT